MNNPFFSVIIPTYNRANFLPIALQSVIDQTFDNWEIILIDDGSTDNTKNVVRSFNDDRIQYFYQRNQERCAARNNGIEKSSGKYICFLDSDDYFIPTRLELLYKEIINLKELFVYIFTGLCFDNKGIITKHDDYIIQKYSNKYDFFMHSHIHCQQTCISRNILMKNKFNINFRIAEDTELWFRIITNYHFIYLTNQSTVVVREHEDRTVNIVKSNVYKEALKVFTYCINTYSYPFSRETIKYMYSDCYFGISRFYIYTKSRTKAIYFLILSILFNIKNKQFKYRFNIIFMIIFNYQKALSLIN